jgi:ribosomal protein S18 acetylase RimI-like enzyme
MRSNLVGCETRPVRNEATESTDYGDIIIRNYRQDQGDDKQMAELAFNNALLGRPFDVVCPCKQWFSDVVLAPYIQHQPENIYVAIHKPDRRLIGYLTGSMGGLNFEKLQCEMVRKKVMSLAVSVSMPWNYFDYSSRMFATHVIFKGESERPSHPQSGVHWHYQVDKDFRGQGIGTKLLQRFTDGAIAAGFDLIWAEVMAYAEKPRAFFEDRGWSIYDSKPTTIFGDHVDGPVQVLCITKRLSSFERLTQAA